MILLEVGPALSLVAVGQVDEAESQGQKTSNAVRCVPRRRRTPHAAAGDHHLEEEEEKAAIGAGSKPGERERKSKRQPFKKSKETALFKVARGASVARRINIVPEQVNQVDDMLIPRSNRDLFHKLLSAPERVSGTDRGGPPRLFKRLKDTYSACD